MNSLEWYFAHGDKQSGPITALELKQKAIAGELKPDDLVWREGMAEWTAARNVRGLFEESPQPPAVGAAAARGASRAAETAAPAAQPEGGVAGRLAVVPLRTDPAAPAALGRAASSVRSFARRRPRQVHRRFGGNDRPIFHRLRNLLPVFDDGGGTGVRSDLWN